MGAPLSQLDSISKEVEMFGLPAPSAQPSTSVESSSFLPSHPCLLPPTEN